PRWTCGTRTRCRGNPDRWRIARPVVGRHRPGRARTAHPPARRDGVRGLPAGAPRHPPRPPGPSRHPPPVLPPSAHPSPAPAGWLHGVALRVAHKARVQRARRHEREVTVVDPVAPTPPDDTADLRRALDEELDRLPEKYRLPIVLCELEGRTLDEAARLLGWPKGTVAGRLSRGRDLLRRRLSRRRGLALPLFLAG